MLEKVWSKKDRKVGTVSAEERARRSERMRGDKNPTHRPDVLAKMSASLRGRTFLARGGNGKLTRQQVALATALGWGPSSPGEWTPELSIPTGPVVGKFESLPPAYKVDIGNQSLMLAVEVDGKTHLTKKWRFLDRRKESVLSALGWKVLRFWNREVDEDLEAVLAKIAAATSTT